MAIQSIRLAAAAVGAFVFGAATVWAVDAHDRKSADGGASVEASAKSGGPRSARPGRGAFAPAVTTAKATRVRVGRTLSAVGEARARQSVVLAAEAAGRVEEIAFTPGEPVEANAVLLRLDDRAQRIELARAKAQYPIAKANADRYRALAADEAASGLEADAAIEAFNVAEAALRTAQFELDQRTVRAPFAGAPGLTTLEPGDYVSIGDAVATLDDVSAIIVEFLIPQQSLRDVALKQAVRVTPTGLPGVFEGRVTAIDTRIDAASRTVRVEATIDAADGAPPPGAVVGVSTTAIGDEALRVPGLAVQWDRNGAYVWTIAKDSAATRTRVAIARRQDDAAFVTGDLTAGDVIIVEGADRVRPGMRFPGVAGRPRLNLGGAQAGAGAGGFSE